MTTIENTITPDSTLEKTNKRISGFDINSTLNEATQNKFKLCNGEEKDNDTILHFTKDNFVTLNGRLYGTGGGFYYLNPLYEKMNNGAKLTNETDGDNFMSTYGIDNNLAHVYYVTSDNKTVFIDTLKQGTKKMLQIKTKDNNENYYRTIEKTTDTVSKTSAWSIDKLKQYRLISNINFESWDKANIFLNSLPYDNYGKGYGKFLLKVKDNIYFLTLNKLTNNSSIMYLEGASFSWNSTNIVNATNDTPNIIYRYNTGNTTWDIWECLTNIKYLGQFSTSGIAEKSSIGQVRHCNETPFMFYNTNNATGILTQTKMSNNQYIQFLRLGDNLFRRIIKDNGNNDFVVSNGWEQLPDFTSTHANQIAANRNDISENIQKIHALEENVKQIDGGLQSVGESLSTQALSIYNIQNVIQNTLEPLVTTINDIPNVYSKLGHTHDDRYYTETEINTKLNNIESQISYITNWLLKMNYVEPTTVPTQKPTISNTSDSIILKFNLLNSEDSPKVSIPNSNVSNSFNNVVVNSLVRIWDNNLNKFIYQGNTYTADDIIFDLTSYKYRYGFSGYAYISTGFIILNTNGKGTLDYVLKNTNAEYMYDAYCIENPIEANDKFNEISFTKMNDYDGQLKCLLGNVRMKGNGGTPYDLKSWNLCLASPLYKYINGTLPVQATSSDVSLNGTYLYQNIECINPVLQYVNNSTNNNNVGYTKCNIDVSDKLYYGMCTTKYNIDIPKKSGITSFGIYTYTYSTEKRVDLMFDLNSLNALIK